MAVGVWSCGMTFQPEHPRYGGRKKGQTCQYKHRAALNDIKAAAQRHGEEIIAELSRIAFEKNADGTAHTYEIEHRIKAMHILLERGYGRPAIDISVATKKSIDDFSDEELAIIAGISISEDGDLEEDPDADPDQLH
jgi:hypothetical protein